MTTISPRQPSSGQQSLQQHESPQQPARRPWTRDEHQRFLDALEQFGNTENGNPWQLMTDHVGTRSVQEVKLHAHDYFVKLQSKQVEREQSLEDTTWTLEEELAFEAALAEVDESVPDRWPRIAQRLPGRTEKDVQRRFQKLVCDIARIHAGEQVQVTYAAHRDNLNVRAHAGLGTMSSGNFAASAALDTLDPALGALVSPLGALLPTPRGLELPLPSPSLFGGSLFTPTPGSTTGFGAFLDFPTPHGAAGAVSMGGLGDLASFGLMSPPRGVSVNLMSPAAGHMLPPSALTMPFPGASYSYGGAEAAIRGGHAATGSAGAAGIGTRGAANGAKRKRRDLSVDVNAPLVVPRSGRPRRA